MNKSIFVFVFFLLLLGMKVYGQDSLANENSSSNFYIQSYTPSVLIKKRQTEFKLFNNLYTQTQFFDESGTKQNAEERSSFFTSIVEYNYGISSKVTLGGELWFKSVHLGPSSTSPLNVLTFSNASNSRSGITLAGIKIKFNPIKKWKRFSVQSGLLINVISDPQSRNLDRPFLDNNRHLWITKFLYDKKISDKIQLFAQFSTWINIDKNLSDENTSLATPVDVFVSYFPTKKLTLFLQNQIFPSIGGDGISSYFLQEGLGAKYQLFKGVEIEVSYTSFILGENAGAGKTINLGLRILN